MKIRKRTLALVIAFITLGGVGIASAGWFGHHGRRMNPEKMQRFVEWRMDSVLSDIDATDAQRDQIKALASQLFEAAKPQLEARGETRKAVLAQLSADTPDAAALHALVDARIDAMRALAHQAVDAGIEAHGVLDAKQRAALAERFEGHGHHD